MKNIQFLSKLILVTLLVVLAPLQSYAKSNFSDVPANAEYEKHLDLLVSKNIISGYPDGTFGATKFITLAQAAKMLVVAVGKENTSYTDAPLQFTGTVDAEGAKFLSIAVKLGYFKKNAQGKVEPHVLVKREDLAYALAKAFDINEKPSSSKPVQLKDVTSHKYINEINGLYYTGITQGTNLSFLPNSNLSRSQFTMFVGRALDPNLRLPIPQAPTEEKPVATVTKVKVNSPASNLNIRSTAGVNGSILGSLQHGTVVEVMDTVSGWYEINYQSKKGYISSAYTVKVDANTPVTPPTTPVTPPTTPPTTSGQTVGKVTAKTLNMRQAPNTSSPTLTSLVLNQKVTVLSINGGWVHVQAGNQKGYVSKIYLKLLNQGRAPLQDRIIVVDAGHGAHDPGTSSNGVIEKAVALDVAKRVEQKLKNAGATVKMTRSTDIFLELTARSAFAKQQNAEAFVSIHINSGPASGHGAETWIDSKNNPNGPESRVLATQVQREMVTRAQMRDRGVKDAAFAVLRTNHAPAILAELGFVTNTADRAKLANPVYLDRYAEAITQGLIKYYSIQ